MNALTVPLLLIILLGAEEQPAAKTPLGKETSYFSAPLDKEGYVDYQAALNEHLGKDITPESNANVLLWQALGPKPDRKKMPAGYFKLLGMDEPPAEGDYFIDLATYLKERAKLGQEEVVLVLQQQSRAGQRPWKAEDYPHVAAWLAANEKPLALVTEASMRPKYFSPLVGVDSGRGPGPLLFAAAMTGAQKSRELARALTARAMLRVELGQIDEAWQDLLACHRWGRHFSRSATLIDSLVGVAFDGIASAADLAFLAHAKSPAPLERLKDLQALPPLPPMADKIDVGERVLFLDALQHIRRGKLNPNGLDAPGRKLSEAQLKALDSLDWMPAMRNANRWFDNMAESLRMESRAEKEEAQVKIMDDLKALGAKRGAADENPLVKLFGEILPRKKTAEELGDTFILLMLPAFIPAHNASDRARQVERNSHLAFALSAFHADAKRYPAKLEELAPKYLSIVLADLFTELPLAYKPDDQGYVLYSVGINGKDEEGRSYGDTPKGDDLVVRMPLPELNSK